MTEHEERHTCEGYAECATCNHMFWGSRVPLPVTVSPKTWNKMDNLGWILNGKIDWDAVEVTLKGTGV